MIEYKQLLLFNSLRMQRLMQQPVILCHLHILGSKFQCQASTEKQQYLQPVLWIRMQMLLFLFSIYLATFTSSDVILWGDAYKKQERQAARCRCRTPSQQQDHMKPSWSEELWRTCLTQNSVRHLQSSQGVVSGFHSPLLASGSKVTGSQEG